GAGLRLDRGPYALAGHVEDVDPYRGSLGERVAQSRCAAERIRPREPEGEGERGYVSEGLGERRLGSVRMDPGKPVAGIARGDRRVVVAVRGPGDRDGP